MLVCLTELSVRRLITYSLYYVIIKINFPVTIWSQESEGEWNVFLLTLLDIRHSWEGKVVSFTCRPHLSPGKFLGTHFFWETEWIPGPVNADRRTRSFEKTSQ